jgi:hypothetical protein
MVFQLCAPLQRHPVGRHLLQQLGVILCGKKPDASALTPRYQPLQGHSPAGTELAMPVARAPGLVCGMWGDGSELAMSVSVAAGGDWAWGWPPGRPLLATARERRRGGSERKTKVAERERRTKATGSSSIQYSVKSPPVQGRRSLLKRLGCLQQETVNGAVL